jgi:hypothetical protein
VRREAKTCQPFQLQLLLEKQVMLRTAAVLAMLLLCCPCMEPTMRSLATKGRKHMAPA